MYRRRNFGFPFTPGVSSVTTVQALAVSVPPPPPPPPPPSVSPLTIVTPPVISGNTPVGSVLTVSTPAVWSALSGFTRSYQWYRSGTAITGATGTSYTTVAAGAGSNITVQETADNGAPSIPSSSNAIGPVVAIPANVIAPALSGAAIDGQILTSSTGTWTGSPTFAYQWQRNGSPIGGATASTYTLVTADVGTTITCLVTGTNVAGSIAASSNSVVPAAAGGSLATPTLTNSSTLGAAPVVLMMGTTDYVAGLRAQLQIDNNSDFSSPEQNIIFFIDGDSWARADDAIGLATPTGTYNARIRILRDNETGATSITDALGNTYSVDASAWSTTFTDTISGSVNALNTTTGANKSQYLTISGSPALSALGTGGVGAPCGVRGTTPTTGKHQFEVTYTAKVGTLYLGIEDGTTALGPALFNLPGKNNSLGVVYDSTGQIWKGGVAVQTGLATLAAGDIVTCEFDTAAGTVSFYRTRSGTTVQIGTTVTGVSFSAYYGYVGVTQNDNVTANFGASSFAHTLNSGYSGW